MNNYFYMDGVGLYGQLTPHVAIQVNKIGTLFMPVDVWKYLSKMDQYVGTTHNVTFNSITDGTATLIGGNLINATNIESMDMTGFCAWDSLVPPFWSILGDQFTLEIGGWGQIRSYPIIFTAPQSVTLTQFVTNIVYIDSTGTLQVTDTVSRNLYLDDIVLFEVFYNGGTFVKKENHPCGFTARVSNYIHDSIGSIVQGAGGNLNILSGTEINILGDAELDDHGLETSITGSVTAITFKFFYIDSLGNWMIHSTTSTMPSLWNNAGTPEALTSSAKWGIYRVYAFLDDLNTITPTYGCVINNAEYANSTEATNAISNGTIQSATENLLNMEPVQLGYIVFKNAGIQSVVIAKSTLNQQFAAGTATSSHLALTDLNVGTYSMGGHTGMCQRHISAAGDPTVNDDIGSYLENTLWLNQTSSDTYVCVDNSLGAAVWKKLIRDGDVIDYYSADDYIKIGNSTDAADKYLHLQSKQSTYIFLEADTDNITETDNPTIHMIQDGSQIYSRFGIHDNEFRFDHCQSGGQGHTFEFRTNGQFAIPSVGSIPVYTVEPIKRVSISSEGMRVDQIREITGGVGVTIDGILLKDYNITSSVNGNHRLAILNADETVGGTFNYATNVGSYSHNSVPGDCVIRNESSSHKIILQAGAGDAVLIVSDVDIKANTINELTAASGVTIDGLKIKDGAVAQSAATLGMKLACYETIYGIGIQSSLMEFIVPASVGDYRWGYGTSGSLTETMHLDSGTKTLSGLNALRLASAYYGEKNIELGSQTVSDNAFIDFHSSIPVTDYDARIIRTPGANGAFEIVNRGTGDIKIYSISGGKLLFGNGASSFSSAGIAIGTSAKASNSHGVSLGTQSGENQTSGSSYNTMIGYRAGTSATDNQRNVCIGYVADAAAGADGAVSIGSSSYCIGSNSISVGTASRASSFSGVSIGNSAGVAQTTSGYCTLVGGNAGQSVTTGDYNTFIGGNAGTVLTTGSSNVVLGTFANAAVNTDSNFVAVGYSAVSTTAGTCIGYNSSAGTYGIALGWAANASANQIIIGSTSNTYTYCRIQGIYGRTSTSGGTVYCNSSGVLGTTTSSRRFKQNIKKTPKEKINKLDDIKVMSYDRIDGSGDNEIGIIAEDLEELDIGPGIIYYDDENKPLGYNREALVPLMIDYIQTLKKRIDQLEFEMIDVRLRLVELEPKRIN